MNTKITENVAKHRVLQTMAFTLKEYNYKELRKVYEAYQMHVTPIESNARTWLEQQIVKGEKPYRYSYNKIRINPERWADVMRTVNPQDLEVMLTFFKSHDQEYGSSRFIGYSSVCVLYHS